MLRAPAGFVRVDCHLHTFVSGDAVTTIDQLAERATEECLDVLCVTDHNEVAGAFAALERGIGARVIVGEEIRTRAGEVIGLFLRERVPYVLPVGDALSRIRAQQGVVYVPHPFDRARNSLREHVLHELCEAGQVDVVECFNAKSRDHGDNDRADDLARRYGLPRGAGSDAHDPEGLGAAYLEMPDFDGPADFVEKLRSGRIVGEFRDHAPRYTQRVAE